MGKASSEFSKRLDALPSELAEAYLADLRATIEERLAFFENLAKKQR